MGENGIYGYYISGTDPHLSEYITERWQTRSYISGFTGSAGIVIVTQKEAALWTDSRYFLQATMQLEGTGIQLMKMRIEGTPKPHEWLSSVSPEGSIIGIDAQSISVLEYRNFNNALKRENLSLKNTGDLLNKIWTNRPPLPKDKIFEHELKYAGESRIKKIDRIRKEMKNKKAEATIISALDDLAWTFNLRGTDVEYNPVFMGYSLITNDNVFLYINIDKIPDKIQENLKKDKIEIKPYKKIFEDITQVKGTILIDPKNTNQSLLECIPINNEILEETSIPNILKSIKSEFELKNIRETLKKDGIAMIDFLFWLYNNVGKEDFTDYDVAMKLNYYRSLQEGYKGMSFWPVVGYKELGAIVHLHVTKENQHKIKKEGMLLFDCGGQYTTGTTDITRTVTLNKATLEEKRDFTIVLKGTIGLSNAKFPSGTKGNNIDMLARKALWDNGKNYGHGTSHGIGYFLNVHEGPMDIRQEYNDFDIRPGMVLSDEPGFYREGHYGIRIENMMTCVKREKTDYGQFYGFETLTLCPIDQNLIDKTLLTDEEIKWINNYHQKCYKELSPLIKNEEEKIFLKTLTKNL